ncbi:hypothetical protein GCM10009733_091430 [Nonomuraea maheshkhaliensis]|uniref:Uncharacterized protein n=1 Tax=Nonomuraea maheshkhaliensis TaxID=419590 RepID=A0ABN2H1F9_9ACTN
MAETIEVHTNVEGEDRAVDLAHHLLRTGLAVSIDLAPVAGSGSDGGGMWKISVLTTGDRLAAVEEEFGRAHGGTVPSVLTFPGGGGKPLGHR